jgi:hypothetical protein
VFLCAMVRVRAIPLPRITLNLMSPNTLLEDALALSAVVTHFCAATGSTPSIGKVARNLGQP